MNKEHVYFVDTKLICYYLFQRGSSITGMYDKIAQLLYDFPKGRIYLGWDMGKSNFRLTISPTYKGHRATAKAKLSDEEQNAHTQFNIDYLKLAELSDMLPVYNLKVQGVECDDLCSILTKELENNDNYQVYLVTADMDWIHSVVGTSNVSIIDVYNGGSLIDHKYVVETYDLDTRRKFTVLKSILGDKADNIKFCSNLGPVKAREIFNLIYTRYPDPTDEQILLVIESYLQRKEEDRVQRKLKSSMSVHPDHIAAGRNTAREAFLANLSIADPFQSVDNLKREEQLELAKCLSRELPKEVSFSDLIQAFFDKLGYVAQFGHKASKVFKIK